MAAPIFVGDLKPTEPAVHLPLAVGLSEELTPVLASIPLSQIGLYLTRLNGRRNYNIPDEAAAREYYDTIHRVPIGEPA